MLNRTALVEEYRRQRESLLATFPELAEDGETLADTLDGMTDATDVIAGLIRAAREDEAMAGGLGSMLRDMGERKARLMARADKRYDAALALMTAIGVRSVVRADFTASIRATPPKVEVTDESALPNSCVKIERRPDKTMIKTQLDAGVNVPGACMGNGGIALTVRVK